MSKRKKYTFNNTFPDHFGSSTSENVNDPFPESSFSSQYHNQLPALQTMELTDSENETQHWSDSEIKSLLSYLSDNFDLFRTNKTQFCARAAMKIGNNRTGTQVKYKIQALIKKFEEENREETGKGRSNWQYFDMM